MDSSMLLDLDLNRYSKIFKTVYGMMRDRNFVPCLGTPSKHSHDEWISHFATLLSDDTIDTPYKFMDHLILFFQRGAVVVMVYFHVIDSKFCKDDIKYVYAKMTARGATSIVLVSKNAVTNDAKRAIETMGPDNQLFLEDSLTYNVTKHQLVPVHRLLTPAEKQKIMKDYSVTESQLPAMGVDDAIAKYYNYKIGDVVRIDRLDGAIYYRVVVAAV